MGIATSSNRMKASNIKRRSSLKGRNPLPIAQSLDPDADITDPTIQENHADNDDTVFVSNEHSKYFIPKVKPYGYCSKNDKRAGQELLARLKAQYDDCPLN